MRLAGQGLDIIAAKPYVAIMNNEPKNTPETAAPDAGDIAGDTEDKVADILKDVAAPDMGAPDMETAKTPEEQVVVLQDLVAKLNETLASKEDEILRYAAELQNTRKRAEKDRTDALKYGVASFARDMVAVGDNLTRALKAIEEIDDTARTALPDNIRALLEGVAATERDLIAALQRNGVKPLNPIGEKFDANFHEAMFEAPDTGEPSGTIIQVVEIGFMIGDRLLRAAKVGVAKN